jgi:hypothetical protein
VNVLVNVNVPEKDTVEGSYVWIASNILQRFGRTFRAESVSCAEAL